MALEPKSWLKVTPPPPSGFCGDAYRWHGGEHQGNEQTCPIRIMIILTIDWFHGFISIRCSNWSLKAVLYGFVEVEAAFGWWCGQVAVRARPVNQREKKLECDICAAWQRSLARRMLCITKCFPHLTPMN